MSGCPCCMVGPEEPHEVCAAGDEGEEPLVMTYFGVVAPEPKPTSQAQVFD
jgi:hypothetical protein